MAEKRKFESVICVKIGAKTSFKIELFPAEQWVESAQGRYRLRINRRWHDGADGKPAYLDMVQVAALVGSLAKGGDLELPQKPDLPAKTRVSAPNGNIIGGKMQYDGCWTSTEPILGYDGVWYVVVFLYGKGDVLMPVHDLIIHKARA